jgi:hypothetical protein
MQAIVIFLLKFDFYIFLCYICIGRGKRSRLGFESVTEVESEVK